MDYIYRKYYKKKQEALEVQRVKQTIDLMLYDITNANKLLGISDDLRFEQIDDKIIEEFKKVNNSGLEAMKPPERRSFTYIKDRSGLNTVIFEILHNRYNQNVIGLDTENESIFSYNGYLCLLQVSTLTQDYIIDLLSINDNNFVAKTFGKNILENEAIVKVVHGGSNDYIWILRDFGIQIKNIYDTQDIYQQLGGKKLALNNLWEIFCNYKMESKTKVKFQKSPWSQRPLPEDMLRYAANDSRFLIYLRYILNLVAIEGPSRQLSSEYPEIKGNLSVKTLSKLYTKMQKEGLSSKENTQSFEDIIKKCFKGDEKHIALESIELFRQKYNFLHEYCKKNDINPECLIDYKIMFKLATNLNLTIYDLEEPKNHEIHPKVIPHKHEILKELFAICNKSITEQDAKTKENMRIFKILTTKTYKDKTAQEKEEKRKIAKDARRKQVKEKFTISKPIYENCQIVAPDGEPLCKCDRQKIDWYLSKGLADVIQEDPVIIKIRFEPNGRGISAYKGDLSADNQYYVDYKKNQCVVCGSEENLIRFQVVPSKYRCFFPERFKAHRSHDILLLCFDCNELAHK